APSLACLFVGVAVPNFPPLPAVADPPEHDIDRPTRSGQAADRRSNHDRSYLARASLEPDGTRFDSADGQVVLDVVFILEPMDVEVRSVRDFVQQTGQLLGFPEIGAGRLCSLSGVRDLVRPQIALRD